MQCELNSALLKKKILITKQICNIIPCKMRVLFSSLQIQDKNIDVKSYTMQILKIDGKKSAV